MFIKVGYNAVGEVAGGKTGLRQKSLRQKGGKMRRRVKGRGEKTGFLDTSREVLKVTKLKSDSREPLWRWLWMGVQSNLMNVDGFHRDFKIRNLVFSMFIYIGLKDEETTEGRKEVPL